MQQEWKQEEMQSKALLNSLNQKKEVKVRRYADDERVEVREVDFQGNPKIAPKKMSEASKQIEGTLDIIDKVIEKIEVTKTKEGKIKAETEFKSLRPVELHKYAKKGYIGESTNQTSKLHKSYHTESGKISTKPNFYEHAQERKLINKTTPTNHTRGEEASIDSTKKKLQEQVENCIDFTEQGKIKRMQKAIRDYNKEKSDFSTVLNNINTKLKRSQFKNMGSRTASLPMIKAKNTPYGLVPFPAKRASLVGNLPEASQRNQSYMSNFN